MSPRFSLAHLTVLECSPPEMVAIAFKTGYAFVSFRLTAVTQTEKPFPLIQDRNLMRETKNSLHATGVRVLDIELARLDPDTEPESCLPFLEAGAELNAKSVITQLPDPDRQRAKDRFARLCELALPFNLTIDLEFPSWTDVPNLETAVDIVQSANSANAGILVDTLHFDRSHSSIDLLCQLPKTWFHFVHLCDAPAIIPTSTEAIIFAAREDRYFPGHGGIDLKQILTSIPDVPYSLEIPNKKLINQLGAEEFARQAIRASESFFSTFSAG